MVTALTPDGARVIANTSDPDVLVSMTRQEWAGRRGTTRTDGRTNALEA